jgi:hypothetical protein
MPEPAFRGDPYRVLDVQRGATSEDIKRRWRELAREHHPDSAGRDPDERARRTTRMARINAAYDVLRDPVRRARYDASPHARRAADEEHERAAGAGPWTGGPTAGATPAGPPPPPPTRPVTARYDTSSVYHARDTRSGAARTPLRGHHPIDWRDRQPERDLRASTPTGPVRRRQGRGDRGRPPTLEEARATVLDFGRFHGLTLGEVADREPTYIDWVARTITRDRDLVIRARVIAADLDERGIERPFRPARPGFGSPGWWEGATVDQAGRPAAAHAEAGAFASGGD